VSLIHGADAADDVKHYDLPESSEYSAGVTALSLLAQERRYFVDHDALESVGGLNWQPKEGLIIVEGVDADGDVVVSHEFASFAFDRDDLTGMDGEDTFPIFYLGSKELEDHEKETPIIKYSRDSDSKSTKYSVER